MSLSLPLCVHLTNFYFPSNSLDVCALAAKPIRHVTSGISKIAAYKDENDVLHTFSAVCPHLGCVVKWNGDEKSFDCPCHNVE